MSGRGKYMEGDFGVKAEYYSFSFAIFDVHNLRQIDSMLIPLSHFPFANDRIIC